jgi:hypothetical protein
MKDEDIRKQIEDEWGKLSDEQRQVYFDKAIEILQDHLTCTRDWSAWSYGTMSQDDFLLAAEDDDIITDTAKMIYDFTSNQLIEARKTIQSQRESLENFILGERE